MSPYVVANGSAATTSARTASVRSGRRSATAAPSSPTPAATKRSPAPRNGATPSRPMAITTHVLDQTSTRPAYRDHTSGRDTAREGMNRPRAGRADDRGPGGRDLAGVGGAGPG